MELKEKRSRTQEAKDIRRAQKEAAGFLDRSTSSTPVKFISRGRRPDVILEKGEVIDFSSLSSSDRTPLTSPSPSPSLDFSAPGTPASHSATPSLLSEADLIPDVMPPQALFHGKTARPRVSWVVCGSDGSVCAVPVGGGSAFPSCFLLCADDDEMEGDGVIDPGMEYTSHPLPARLPRGQGLEAGRRSEPLSRSSRRWRVRRRSPTGWTSTARTQTPTRPCKQGLERKGSPCWRRTGSPKGPGSPL